MVGEEIRPHLVAGARIAMKRLGTPEDIGAATLFFASKASSWITGQSITVDGGLSGIKLAPPPPGRMSA